MWMAGLMVAGLVLSAGQMYMNLEEAKKQAELQKGNIEIEQQKLALQKEAADMEKEVAEADAREKARIAKSQVAMKQAMSGAEGSIYDAMEQSIETDLESGVQNLYEQYGIRGEMDRLAGMQLSNNLAGISSSSDMELSAALGIGASLATTGASMYYMNKGTTTNTAGITNTISEIQTPWGGR